MSSDDDIHHSKITSAVHGTEVDSSDELYNEKLSATVHDKQVPLGDEVRANLATYFGRKAEEDDIAPSQDVEYLFDRIAVMTVEEAIETLRWAQVEFSNDWNMPVETTEKIKRLLDGPDSFENEDDYLMELKTEAAILKYSSPYPEVRAVADTTDDPTLPVETVRAYFLALAWTCVGLYVNNFFMPRFPSISLSSSVLQILLYPCGVALAMILPDWGVTVFGVRHSLNPGPWSFKEQMFATIVLNVAITTPYVYWNIMVQKLPMYYNVSWVTFGYEIMLTLSNQFLGFGFAGLMRRFVVYPSKAIFPTVLPTIALTRALTKVEPKRVINGWKISSYNFFWIAFAAMFVYFWIPNYLMTCISTFNWMTWIAPDNYNLALITGSTLGLGINPWPTFDWNVVTGVLGSPLTLPFWSWIQTYSGFFVSGFIVLGIYMSNLKWTGYMPMNSSAVRDNRGHKYNVSRVMVDGLLDEEKYKNYSPPFYSAGSLVSYGAFFALYPLNFIYSYGTQWPLIKEAFISLYQSIRYNKGAFEDRKDPHCVMMSKYKEVPEWCYFILLIISLVFTIIVVEVWRGVKTPVWIIFVVLLINLVFLLPMCIMAATTGSSIGLNVLVELIVGYIFPGNPEVMIFVKAFGYKIDGQAESYITDQKIAHYAKIPPWAIFRGQLLSTFISSFLSVAVTNWLIANVDGLCTDEQPAKFTCAADAQIYFSASVMWGLIGPSRIFDQIYPIMKWAFFLGFLVGLFYVIGDKFGPIIYKRAKSSLEATKFAIVDKFVFNVFRAIGQVNPVLIGIGAVNWAPYNLSYATTGTYFSWIFMYYIKRRYQGWWEKYNYLLSVALGAGVAFSGVIIFFAVQYHEKDVNWRGNTISYDGIDGANLPRLDIPDAGYFGPEKGTWY